MNTMRGVLFAESPLMASSVTPPRTEVKWWCCEQSRGIGTCEGLRVTGTRYRRGDRLTNVQEEEAVVKTRIMIRPTDENFYLFQIFE